MLGYEQDFLNAFSKTIVHLSSFALLFHFTFDFFKSTTESDNKIQQVEVMNFGDQK